MDSPDELLAGNRAWAEATRAQDPGFFDRLAAGQSPRYLWIGCSDSRVPETQVCGLEPGAIFVHRNIANQASQGDGACAAVVEFAVEVLGVTDIVVCGHERCGGVQAALEGGAPQAVDRWLAPLRALAADAAPDFGPLDPEQRVALLVEKNVTRQVEALAAAPPVRAAWDRGAELRLHGLVFGLSDGLLRDLGVGASR